MVVKGFGVAVCDYNVHSAAAGIYSVVFIRDIWQICLLKKPSLNLFSKTNTDLRGRTQQSHLATVLCHNEGPVHSA